MNTIDLINKQIEFLEKCRDELSCDEQKFPFFRLSPGGDFIVRIDYDAVENTFEGEVVASSNQKDHVNSQASELKLLAGSILNNWKEVPYDENRGLFHGQLVWAWDDEDTHRRILGFYNEVDGEVCSFRGNWGEGALYDNYAPYEHDWPEWAYEAFGTLELGI